MNKEILADDKLGLGLAISIGGICTHGSTWRQARAENSQEHRSQDLLMLGYGRELFHSVACLAPEQQPHSAGLYPEEADLQYVDIRISRTSLPLHENVELD